MQTEPVYKKVGRRYVPIAARWYENRDTDEMKVGTFRLTYAYSDGGRRFEYDVTPDTAGWVAAAMVARQAMEDAIRAVAPAKPRESAIPYTKRELKVLAQARALFAEAGMMFPEWWQYTSPWEFSEIAINAVKNYRP